MKLVVLTLFCCLSLVLSEPDEFIQTTGYRCDNEFAKLECGSDKMIIITKVMSRKSELYDCTLIHEKFTDYSEFEYDFKERCNGRQSCSIKFQAYDHMYGLFKSKSDFRSNRVNVYYTCIPKTETVNVNSYCICEDDVISDVEEGFIHSPNYPNYYGNNRNCRIDVKLPSSEHRLIAYLISMNVENKGWLSRKPKDYLLIENTAKSYFGSEGPQMALFDNKQATFRFRSDLITTAFLDSPKGFLIYFKILKTSPPTTTATTAATNTATNTATATATTVITTTPSAPVVVQLLAEENEKETNDDPLTVNIDDVIVDNSASAYKLNSEDRTPSRPDRSALLACIIVGLCGLVVILLTTILLLIRRRQSQQDPSSGDYSNYSFVDKIRGYYTSKKEKPSRVLEISAPRMLNEAKKAGDVDENKKKEDDELNNTTENIYVTSPVVVVVADSDILTTTCLNSAPTSDEIIYDTINEHEAAAGKPTDSEDSSYVVIVDEQNIYSTPSNNKELSPDEKRIFIELNNSDLCDTSQNTSKTFLLP